MAKQFIDNDKTSNLNNGVEYYAVGLVVEDVSAGGGGKPSGKDYTVEYIDPWGKYHYVWRSVSDITISDIDDSDAAALKEAYHRAKATVVSTPANRWSLAKDPDPHDERYDVERAALTLGDHSDDELANAVYLHGNRTPPIVDVLAGKAKMPIVFLTAAKDRIRWLSRRLSESLAEGQNLRRVMTDAACLLREYEAHHRAKGGDDSLAKAERNRVMAEQLESCIERKASTL